MSSWLDFNTQPDNDDLTWLQSVFFILVAYPAGVVAGLICILRLYCRYTMGRCHCTTDLKGKTVVITGGNSGIGKVTAMQLARRNARVIIGCRSIERGLQAVEDIKAATGNLNVKFKKLDLCSFASVRKFAREIERSEHRLHILINNAGISKSGGKRVITEDGCESIMQANHLGHFLLTLMLTDLLKKSAPSRIINVSSLAYKFARLDLDDLKSKRDFSALSIYCKTKIANLMFTTEMSKRLAGTGVTVNALHPGVVKTDIVKNIPMNYGSCIHLSMTRTIFFFFGKTALEGAQTSLHLALSPKLQRTSGKFFSDCKEQKMTGIALDQNLARKLWKKSEDIVGFKMKFR